MIPAGGPKQSEFVNQFRKSWKGIVDKESFEGGIWEESGLGIGGKHLGDIWEASGRQGARGGPEEAGIEKVDRRLQPNAKVAFIFFNFTRRF